MKAKPTLYLVMGMAVLGCLLASCNTTPKMACPKSGEELVDPNPGEERVSLTLQNDTCMSVCVLLVSPDHCEYMGGVNYVEGHPLRSEEEVSVELPPGKYTAWVELCTEEFRADEHLNVKSDTVRVLKNKSLIDENCEL